MDTSLPRWTLWVAAIITATSSVFVLWHLSISSFWHDEAFSGLLIRYNWSEMFTRIAADVHPPLYYILIRGWAALWGGGVYSLRAFSYVFGLATAWATYVLTMAIYRRRDIALISCALLLTNSFVIQYLMEARMYTLGCLLLTLATYLLLKAIDGVTATRSFSCAARWLGFGILAGLALLTHYYAGIYIIALGLYGLYRAIQEGWTARGKHILQGLVLSGVTATLLFLPWLKVFLDQVTRVEQSYWIGGVTWWSVPETLFKMLTGFDGHPEIVAEQIAMIAVIVLSLWVMYRGVSRAPALASGDVLASQRAWVIPVLVVVPFIIAIVLSLKTSIYFYRYFIYTLPFFIPMLVAALASLTSRNIRVAVIMLVLVGSAILFPWRWYALDLNHKPGMRAITSSLDTRITPNDHVVVGTSLIFFNYRYHKTNTIPEKLYAPNTLLHYSGTALLSDGDAISSFDNFPAGTHVWTIDTTGFYASLLTPPATWQLLSEMRAPDMYDFKGDIILREWSVK